MSRNIKAIANKNGIKVEKNRFCIYKKDETDREAPEKYLETGTLIIGLEEKDRNCDDKIQATGNGKKD